jgi:hypothetical protein
VPTLVPTVVPTFVPTLEPGGLRPLAHDPGAVGWCKFANPVDPHSLKLPGDPTLDPIE